MSEIVKDSFVYRWTNNSNGMMYIGVHKGTPDDGYICSSKTMKEAYNSNPEHFTREILEYGSFAEMYDRETELLIENNVVKNLLYYNKCINGKEFRMDFIPSLKTREKMSVAQKKRYSLPEEREKISRTSLGRKHTDESKEKIRLANLGKIHSDETKEKMKSKKQLIVLGELNKNETKRRRNISLSHIGKKLSNETKEKIRQSLIGRKRVK